MAGVPRANVVSGWDSATAVDEVNKTGVAGFEPDCESSLALGFAWFELR